MVSDWIFSLVCTRRKSQKTIQSNANPILLRKDGPSPEGRVDLGKRAEKLLCLTFSTMKFYHEEKEST